MSNKAKDINHSERAHALLSASGASRWMNCTPSPRLEEQMGTEDTSSVFAEEGTLAHELADLMLHRRTERISASEYKGKLQDIESHALYSEEMPEEVEKYVTYVVEEYKARNDARLFIEERIDLTDYIEDGFGTGDAAIVADGVLEIIDLKYGKGLRVSAEENPQLMLYGLGLLTQFELHYDIDTVRLTVAQPRLDNISSWDISADALREWAETQVRPKALLAYAGEGEAKAGAHCQWCKVAPKCRALANANLELAKHEFCDPKLLSDAELLDIRERIPLLSKWATSVESHVLKEALLGKKWDGLKLVAGRSIRKITNEDTVKGLLGTDYEREQYLNEKLKGLGDLEKLLGKSKFNELLGAYIIKPEGKPTLAPEDDKRPALGIEQAKTDFK